MAEIVTSTYHGAPLVCAFIDNKLEFLEFIRNKELNNIYIGRVENIVKNIDAAFVRFHDDEIGYLPLKSVLPVCVVNRKLGKKDSIRPGDVVVVQVEVEKLKTKKTRLTTYISLSGKYTVITLGRHGVGASLKLDDKTRKGLIENVKKSFTALTKDSEYNLSGTGIGMIIRTNAMDITSDIDKTILNDASECIDLLTNILNNALISSLFATASVALPSTDTRWLMPFASDDGNLG